MKKFDELDESLQNEIIDICKDDIYDLNPRFLYVNIYFSTGSTLMLSELFEVPEALIIKIKEEGEN